MKKVLCLTVLTVFTLSGMIFAVACGSSAEESPLPPDTREPAVSPGLPPAPADSEGPPEPAETWNPDGILSDNEYLGEMRYGDFEIRWWSDRINAYFGIRAKTEGWVAVGFNPTNAMKDADMVFGLVENGQASVSDQFSTGTYGPHQLDVELGGRDNILVFGGREEGGFTTIEFSRALITGDEYDNNLSLGVINIIWSYSHSDNIGQKHVVRGYGEISL